MEGTFTEEAEDVKGQDFTDHNGKLASYRQGEAGDGAEKKQRTVTYA